MCALCSVSPVACLVEAKPALASSHTVRVMWQEVWRRSLRPAETSSLWGDRGKTLPTTTSVTERDLPPAAARGSAFCNRNQDTLYQLWTSRSKFRHRHRNKLDVSSVCAFHVPFIGFTPSYSDLKLCYSIAHCQFTTTLLVKPLRLFYFETKPSFISNMNVLFIMYFVFTGGRD